MPLGRFLTFDDPDHFQAAVRAPNYEVLIPSRGNFRAALTRVDFDRLWMQRTVHSGPAAVRFATYPTRLGIMFLADSEQAPPLRDGAELCAQQIFVRRPGSVNHLRSREATRLAVMSLPLHDAAAAGLAIADRELATPPEGRLIRPPLDMLPRLRSLHAEACRLAESDAHAFDRPGVVKALEHDLIHAMIACLTAPQPQTSRHRGRHHSRVMARFEAFLEARRFEPVYLTEICAAIGASERTLRNCCHERFGMGPMRYLWLRRMHLARRALLRADPTLGTVTEVATEHGFCELGRFSVEYRKLFGEAPSATLRRPPEAARSP